MSLDQSFRRCVKFRVGFLRSANIARLAGLMAALTGEKFVEGGGEVAPGGEFRLDAGEFSFKAWQRPRCIVVISKAFTATLEACKRSS